MLTEELPIIVISGGTGTGKTKLSIEIAKHYGGEIINADALQIYNGMNVATNKVTEKESQGIPHHLIGFKDIKSLNFTVCEFQTLALEKINEIKNKNKMPVIVGGTNYYIESILWETLVTESNEKVKNLNRNEFDEMNNNELHKLLNELDCKTASILHPNDRRKVIRAIEIAKYSSKNKYEYFNDQSKNSRRFNLNKVVFLWIYSNSDCLFPRLEKRVDDMINLGLLFELEEIQKLYESISPDKYTQGIFQAIGFKEFHDYLNCSNENAIEKEKILMSCIQKLKIATKNYVKTQNQWVKNRFLRKSTEVENIPLFKLDSSNLTKWEENVFQRSICVIEQVRHSTNEKMYSDFVEQLHIKPEPLSDEVKYVPSRNICNVCDNQLFISEQQWQVHLNSRRHQKRVKKFKNDLLNVEIINET